MARKRSHHYGKREGEPLSQALIREGLALIEEVGEDGFSVRLLARKLGVSPTAPLQHFRNLDHLLLALAQEGFGQLEADMRAATTGADNPRETVIAGGTAYVDFAAANPRLYQLMFSPRFGNYETGADEPVSLQPNPVDVLKPRVKAGPAEYVEAHRQFVAPLYELLHDQMRELSNEALLEARTLGVSLLLHGLASETAAGWIRRDQQTDTRRLVERYLDPFLR